MTETSNQTADSKPRSGLLRPMIFGVAGAIILGGGAFYAAYSGLLSFPRDLRPTSVTASSEFAFVPIEVITVSLPPQSGARLVRVAGQIEVTSASHEEMMRLQPRFIDVIITYLHAVEVADLRQPAALIRLRAQLLRRLQVIAGGDHVKDFLITEFLLD